MINEKDYNWLAIEGGAAKYDTIMKSFNRVDVSKDERFQKTFTGFYRIRRSKELFLSKYYEYMESLKGKNVIVIEDIIDTGNTAQFLISYFKMQHGLDNIKFATLLNKECARKHDIKIDYSGFVIEDYFVVGYGLDYCGYYRNLPYVGYYS